MSGEPTDAQLLTCKAIEVRAVANRIDASYGNCIYIYFFFRFSKISDLVACYYFMYKGGRLHG